MFFGNCWSVTHKEIKVTHLKKSVEYFFVVIYNIKIHKRRISGHGFTLFSREEI